MTPSNRWLSSILFALFLSNAGTFLQSAAQSWHLWEQTHSASMLGWLALAQASLLLGISLLGGVLADRFPRRWVLLGMQTLMAALAASMGILATAGLLSPLLTIVGAGLLTALTAVDTPVRQVYLPSVVLQQQRARVIALNALAYNSGAMIGPAMAGILLSLTNVGLLFFINALSYCFVIGLLSFGPQEQPSKKTKEEANSLFQYGRQTPAIFLLLLMVALVSLFGRSYPYILPVLVSRLGGASQTYGLLAGLPGVGALLAAGLLTWMVKKAMYPRLQYGGILLLAGSIIGVGVAANLPLAALFLFFIGLAATGTMTMLNIRLQTATSAPYRGRVMSLYTWLAAGMPALGGWLLATSMKFIPLPVLLLPMGGVLMVSTLFLRNRRLSKV